MRLTRFPVALFVLALLLAPALLILPNAAAANDAGTGADADNTFEGATSVSPTGRYWGRLDAGDAHDYYKFHVEAGASIDIDVDANLRTGSIQVADAPRRIGIRLLDPNGVLLDTPNTNVADARVTWPVALVAGEYRLQFAAQNLGQISYSFCFVVTSATCASPGIRHIDLGVPLPTTHANVLLVPPLHGNPTGSETVFDYLDATISGIRNWQRAFEEFALDYPEYAYLTELTVHVEVFDGVAPQRAGYDVIIAWLPYTGPQFRGLAWNIFGAGPAYTAMCSGVNDIRCRTWYSTIEPVVHDSTRLIFLSLYANSPRAGQVTPDYPEYNDVFNVAMHEFAHTWGLIHTTTYTVENGPDLMNSPYMDVFGDGHPISDGMERTPAYCISSLDLYGMARLYEWVGRDAMFHQRFAGYAASLPSWMPYELYC